MPSWRSSREAEAQPGRGDDEICGRLDADAAGVDAEVVILEGTPVASPVTLHVLLARLVALLDLVLRFRGVDAAMLHGIVHQERLPRVTEDVQSVRPLGQQRLCRSE